MKKNLFFIILASAAVFTGCSTPKVVHSQVVVPPVYTYGQEPAKRVMDDAGSQYRAHVMALQEQRLAHERAMAAMEYQAEEALYAKEKGVTPPVASKQAPVFDYSQTPVVANRRPVVQTDGQAAPSMPVVQAPVMPVVETPNMPVVYAVQQPVYTVSQPIVSAPYTSVPYYPVYGGYQPVYTVTTGSDGFAWSSLGFGAFIGASINSYPVTHRVRVYESSVNATYSFGGHSGGGGGQHHGGGGHCR